jgi:hypothetical protein
MGWVCDYDEEKMEGAENFDSENILSLETSTLNIVKETGRCTDLNSCLQRAGAWILNGGGGRGDLNFILERF